MTQHMFLVKVTHNPKKNEIICYFQNDYKKLAKKFVFFPSLNIPKEINSVKLKNLLLFNKIKNFKIVKFGNKKKLITNTFCDLKKISLLLARLTNKKLIVVSPQKNFLLDKNWSYFDSFLISDSSVQKSNELIDFSKFIFKEISFLEAKKLSKKETDILIQKYVLSNLLKIPIEEVILKKEKINEIFIENIFFKNSWFINWEKNSEMSFAFEFEPFGVFEKISQIEFSSIWPKLISKNFFNIGFENMNCSCCKPIKLDDKNLLESSFIEIIINQDNLFFESFSQSFSNHFHKNNFNKEKRLLKKKEFWFKKIPIGPFFKNQKVLIPLSDAKKLLDEGLVSLVKNHKICWSCNKKNNFLSTEIELISKKIFDIDKKLNKIESKKSLFSEKIFIEEYLHFSKYYLEHLVTDLPFHLTDSESLFFNYRLASAIIFMQESIIEKFNNFSEKTGFRVIHANKKNAFIKGFSPILLTNQFSIDLNLPKPKISNFSAIKKFR